MGILQAAYIRNENDINTLNFNKIYDEMNTSLSFLELLINDILDINRISKGIFKIDTRLFDFEKLCRECLNVVKTFINEDKPDLKFTLNYTAHKMITSDPSRLKQILLNFLTNSIKFTTKGSIDLTIKPYDRNKNMLFISISDTGKGIPEDK